MMRLLGTLLGLGVAFAAVGAETTRPNIVILYADDMGWGDLAVQNSSSKIPTPNLDQLAREGLRFTDAHSSSGVCTPSRYALLHGRYHWRKFHGIVNSFDQPVLDDARLTIAEVLRTKGYRTACIGKWHLGWDWNAIKQPGATIQGDAKKAAFTPASFDWSKAIPGGPLSHGFDYYFGDDVPNFPPYAWFENDRVVTVPTVPLTTAAATAEGSWEARPGPSVKDWDFWAVMPRLTEKAVEWIGKQKPETPFFLYFPFTSPPSARDTHVHNTNPDGYAIRHGDWVLIDAKSGGVSAVPTWFDEANGYAKNPHPGELYNLRDNLAQKNNLYGERPEKVAELKGILTRLRTQGQVRDVAK